MGLRREAKGSVLLSMDRSSHPLPYFQPMTISTIWPQILPQKRPQGLPVLKRMHSGGVGAGLG